MSHRETRGARYRARFTDPTGAEHSRTFTRKADAQRFLRELDAAMLRGSWVDPRDADIVWWNPRPGRLDLTAPTVRHTTIIGAAQILALWPGMSRSLLTIAAALAIGASVSAAVEFSFLLGLATLSAATLYDLAKNGQTLLADYGWRTPLLGGLVAFITAVVAVRWLVSFLHTHPLSIFGWYRIGIAVTVAGLIGIGAI